MTGPFVLQLNLTSEGQARATRELLLTQAIKRAGCSPETARISALLDELEGRLEHVRKRLGELETIVHTANTMRARRLR